MVTVAGTATSRGFVSGPVFLYAGDRDLALPEYRLPADKVGAELARYREARAETRRQLEGVVTDVAARVTDAEADIFKNHLVILEDEVIIAAIEKLIREERLNVEAAMRRVVESVAMGYGCTAELDFTVATEVLYSDPAVTRLGMQSVAKIVGAENAVSCGPKMIAEDFCYYTLHAPSVFFNLGARVPDESKVFPLHSDHVVFDENAIEVGASVFIQTAVDLLDELNAESNKE